MLLFCYNTWHLARRDMKLKGATLKLVHLRQRLRRRHGHRPGKQDVRLSGTGQKRHMQARVNFYYFEGCGRPCYLPLNPAPCIGDAKWAVTDGWPCEYYTPHDRSSGPHCYSETPREGSWLMVIGQVVGQPITNEIGQTSDIWNVIVVASESITRNHRLLDSHYQKTSMAVVFAPDIWMGNTGWQFEKPTVLTSMQANLYSIQLPLVS